jgi:ribonuclease PH
VALADAVEWLHGEQRLRGAPEKVLYRSVAAISVGVIEGEPRLDLNYLEDVAAAVDMNVVCTGDGDFVEVQGTGESAVFSRAEMESLLDLAVAGCTELAERQRVALA